MSIVCESGWLLCVFYVATRLAGVFFLVPVLGMNAVPATVRVLFILIFSLLIACLPQVQVRSTPAGLGMLALGAASEFVSGALVGMALQAMVAAFGFGGQIADFQVGFSAAALFDPTTQVQSSLLSTTLAMFGALAFVVLDFHQVLLRGLARFFVDVPPGSLVSGLRGDAAVAHFGLIFVYGFAIVAPVVLGLMLVDIVVAVASRSMPQVNVYFVALPFKVFAGLFLLGYAAAYVGPLATGLFEKSIRGMSQAF